jgi:hypothetical protein
MIPKIIYTYWEGRRFPYIDYCLETLTRSGVEVVRLDLAAARKIVKGTPLNPNWEKIENIAQKCDCIRLAALWKTGGMWCDADTVMLRDCAHLFETEADFTGMRWTRNRRLLNGYFLAKKGSKFLAACIEEANRHLEQGLSAYTSNDGVFMGEELFMTVQERCPGLVVDMPLATLIPVEFPTDAKVWEKPLRIKDHLKPETVAVALNHSQMTHQHRIRSMDVHKAAGNLLASVFCHSAGEEPPPTAKPVSAPLPVRRSVPPKTLEHHPGGLCIMTVVDYGYLWYAPLFVRCARAACPDAAVRVYCRKDVPQEVFDRVQALSGGALQMLEEDPYPEGGRVAAAMRFLVDDPELRRFDYVLIQDADILMYRETTPLVDQHMRHLKSDGTECYENWGIGVDGVALRVPGVHFVTKAWWAATEDARRDEKQRLIESGSAEEWGTDELMVGRIIYDSGLPRPPSSGAKLWRHHGVHLGDWRQQNRNGFIPRPDVWQKMHIADLLKDTEFIALAAEAGKHIPLIPEILKRWPILFRG